MAELKEQNLGKGSLFINQHKTETKHPDYQGSINLCGYTERMASWLSKDDKGTFLACVLDKSRLKVQLYLNTNRENEKAPLYKGEVTYNGEKYNISGWLNSKEGGIFWLSIKAEKQGEFKKEGKAEGIGNALPPTGFPTSEKDNVLNSGYPEGASLPKNEPAPSVPNDDADGLPF